MARFLEILLSLRKFITKWKEIRPFRPKIQPERIISFGFAWFSEARRRMVTTCLRTKSHP
ncbi:hypothetical protein TAL182_CH03433 [Rhizobium sp. TAL182]|nr:hypothetical protein TAL182_CH03433 [Rhizobium sp. TAL182]